MRLLGRAYHFSLLICYPCSSKVEREQQIRITNTHEEASVIMVNQAYDTVLQNGVSRVHVVCNDWCFCSFNLVLLEAEYYCRYQNATDSSIEPVDINKTVESYIDVIPCLLSAHALSGCDTTARYYGIAKGTVVKQFKKGLQPWIPIPPN